MKLEAAMLAGPFKRPAWSMIRRHACDTFQQWNEASAQWFESHWSPVPDDILADDWITVGDPEASSPQALAQDQDAFNGALENFLIRAQDMLDKEYFKRYQHVVSPKLEKDPGRRYIRIVRHERDAQYQLTGGRSVYCFVDKTNGDILKAASFKAPAKHARGNIFGEDPLAAVTTFGAKYLR